MHEPVNQPGDRLVREPTWPTVATIAWTSGAIRSAPRVGDQPARSVREGVAVLFGPDQDGFVDAVDFGELADRGLVGVDGELGLGADLEREERVLRVDNGQVVIGVMAEVLVLLAVPGGRTLQLAIVVDEEPSGGRLRAAVDVDRRERRCQGRTQKVTVALGHGTEDV